MEKKQELDFIVIDKLNITGIGIKKIDNTTKRTRVNINLLRKLINKIKTIGIQDDVNLDFCWWENGLVGIGKETDNKLLGFFIAPIVIEKKRK